MTAVGDSQPGVEIEETEDGVVAMFHQASVAVERGDEQAGREDCELCRGEDQVPVFEDRDGVHMPVGYRPFECVGEA